MQILSCIGSGDDDDIGELGALSLLWLEAIGLPYQSKAVEVIVQWEMLEGGKKQCGSKQ